MVAPRGLNAAVGAFAVLAAPSLVSCSALLGGLEEAAPAEREADASDAGASTAHAGATPVTAGSRCRGGLPGFAYRTPGHIDYAGVPVPGYQVPITLDTASLIAAGKMRIDGADLRVTEADGVTPVPHWIERGLNTDSTLLWIRIDIAPSPTDVWLQYGALVDHDESSLEDTFVQGVLDDPHFERPSAWTVRDATLDTAPNSRTNEWSIKWAKDSVTITLFRKVAANGDLAGICQSMLFPAGSLYLFSVDAKVIVADHGGPTVWSANLDQLYILNNLNSASEFSHPERYPIPPGRTTLCVGVGIGGSPVGQGVQVTYSRLRLRRAVPEPPTARLGPEQPGCP